MLGLFPCSWNQPMVNRRRLPKLLNAAYDPPVKPKPIPCSYLPVVIPREEFCPLVAEDRELDQAILQIQQEADANYEPSQVLDMAERFNHNLDGAIERLNTTPPKEQPVVEAPALLDLMVIFSRFGHILERCIKKNQP